MSAAEPYRPPLGLPPLTDAQVQTVAALLSAAPPPVPSRRGRPPVSPSRVKRCQECGAEYRYKQWTDQDGHRRAAGAGRLFCSRLCAQRAQTGLSAEEAAIRAGMTEAQVMRRAHVELEAWIAEHPERTEASA